MAKAGTWLCGQNLQRIPLPSKNLHFILVWGSFMMLNKILLTMFGLLVLCGCKTSERERFVEPLIYSETVDDYACCFSLKTDPFRG